MYILLSHRYHYNFRKHNNEFILILFLKITIKSVYDYRSSNKSKNKKWSNENKLRSIYKKKNNNNTKFYFHILVT